MTRAASFDRIARPYRWLEYLTFGRKLERCRFHFLPQLHGHSRALVLGDGDGRFLARLLEANSTLQADAVDTSATMLRLLTERCHPASSSGRLHTHNTSAQNFLSEQPALPTYDLVVTHFFLDCLTQPQLDLLVSSVTSRSVPGAIWLVSDFQIPAGAMRLSATLLIPALYFAFRTLTGLRVKELPNYATPLSAHGFRLSDRQTSLAGMLATEIWIFTPAI